MLVAQDLFKRAEKEALKAENKEGALRLEENEGDDKASCCFGGFRKKKSAQKKRSA